MKSFAYLLAFALLPSAWSKNCTESDIRNAVSQKKRFDFDAEGCSSSVIYISKGIGLGGGVTIDGRGKMQLSWKGSGSQCDEIPRGDEYATFYTTGNNNVIKNLTILKSPEGIHLSRGKGNIVDNVTFEKICEDAITNGNKSSSSATDSIIRNSTFKNAPDKAIQCNGGSMTVESSEFRNVPRSIAGCTYKADGSNHDAKECPTPCTIKAYNNDVYGCSGGYGMRASGYLQKKKVGSLTAIGNHFRDCRTPFIASQYGFIYAENNTSEGRCDQFAKTEQNSTGEVCNNRGCSSEYSGSIVRKCRNQPAPTPTPNPDPTPAPNPNPPSSQIEIFEAIGKGGTQTGNHTDACKRAQDRALTDARGQCDGTVLSAKAAACSCKKESSKVSNCQAAATVQCQS